VRESGGGGEPPGAGPATGGAADSYVPQVPPVSEAIEAIETTEVDEVVEAG
jgi:hypothetical protein